LPPKGGKLRSHSTKFVDPLLKKQQQQQQQQQLQEDDNQP
jgi:hypothetical protein